MIFFIFTHDNIQKGVKLETSLLAVRHREQSPKGEEVSRYEELVMDEGYDVLFKRLFEQAHAEVIATIPSQYIAHTHTDLTPVVREFADFSKDRDFVLWVDMPEEFPMQYRKSIDIKVEQFMIDYICWRWFETKLPQEAISYYGRLESTKEEIQRMLNKRKGGVRRMPSFP